MSVVVRACATLLVLASCVQPSSIQCENGLYCPSDRVCDEMHGLCVLPVQLDACAGLAEQASCTIVAPDDGVCIDDVCIAQECGDGFVSGTEQCDGDDLAGMTCESLGAHQPGTLTCNASCAFDTRMCGAMCGDGMIDGPAGAEECDGTDLPVDRDDCLELGFYEPGPVTCTNQCSFNDNMCRGFCGDGVANGHEACDGADPQQGACIDFGFDAGHLGCNAFCTPAFDACGVIGWRNQLTGNGQDNVALLAISEVEVYAGGNNGLIRRFNGAGWSTEYDAGIPILSITRAGSDLFATSTNGIVVRRSGGTWSSATIDTASNKRTFESVWGSSTTDVWAVGAEGVLAHFNGSAWTITTAPSFPRFLDVWGTAPNNVWAGDADGNIWHYDGQAWTSSVLESNSVKKIWGTSADDVWAVGSKLWHFANNQWTEVTAPFGVYISVTGTAPNNVFIGALGQVLHFDGMRWTTLPLPGNALAYAIAAPSTEAVFVGTSGGLVLQSLGAQWKTEQATGFLGAWGSSPDDVYALDDGLEVNHYDGANWTNITSSIATPTGHSAVHRAVWGTSATDVFIGGMENNTTAASMVHLGASGWTRQTVPASVKLIVAIHGVSSSTVFASAVSNAIPDYGQILRYNGSTWTLETLPDGTSTATILAIWARSATDVFASAGRGEYLHYDGVAWTKHSLPVTSLITAFWDTGSSLYAATDEGDILRYAGGNQWTTETTPGVGRGRAIWGSAEDDVFVLGDTAVLHFDGVRWSPMRLPLPSFPPVVWGARNMVGFFYAGGSSVEPGTVLWLHREALWQCRATETSCSDAIDDDCDNLIDADDPDC